jgi:protein tyrosine/serine phosphatase
MTPSLRWALGLALAALMTIAPYMYYRAVYTHGKRLREVEPGVLYRSGQLTVAGFKEAIERYHIRTIINAQDEYPDPDLSVGFFDHRTLKETELCRQLGVNYVFLPPDLLPRRYIPERRPKTVDRFLALMDNPANYPVLIHCKAGLHRTGVLVAVYRMEYQGFPPQEAVQDLKDNGFGEFVCSSANDYIMQYILTYRPGQRGTANGGHELTEDNEPHSPFPVPHSLLGR